MPVIEDDLKAKFVLVEEESKTKYICDVCKTYVWTPRNRCPSGWCTTREDHDNIVCPDCNPYIERLKNPIAKKMKLVEESYIPSPRQELYGCY